MEKYLEEIRYKILLATCKRYFLSSVSCYLSLSVAVAMPILTNYLFALKVVPLGVLLLM